MAESTSGNQASSATADREQRGRQLHERLIALYRETGEASRARGRPYWPSRYLQFVQRHGGLEAARRWLARPDPQAGLGRLQELDLLQLSLEACVLEPRFRPLFRPEELAVARRRLTAGGYAVPD